MLDPVLLSIDPAENSEDVAAQQAYLAALTQPQLSPDPDPVLAVPEAGSDGQIPAATISKAPNETASPHLSAGSADPASSPYAALAAAASDGHSSPAESSEPSSIPVAEGSVLRPHPSAVRHSTRSRRLVGAGGNANLVLGLTP